MMINWGLVRYFELWEFSCNCGCNISNPSKNLVYKLNAARVFAGIPFHLNSACRCATHNIGVGGSINSAHLTSEVEEGEAVDIHALTSEQKFIVVEALIKAGFKRIFIYDDFVHGDVDSEKPSPSMRAY